VAAAAAAVAAEAAAAGSGLLSSTKLTPNGRARGRDTNSAPALPLGFVGAELSFGALQLDVCSGRAADGRCPESGEATRRAALHVLGGPSPRTRPPDPKPHSYDAATPAPDRPSDSSAADSWVARLLEGHPTADDPPLSRAPPDSLQATDLGTARTEWRQHAP
jgi:hypothetical protein